MNTLALSDVSRLAREAKGEVDRLFLHWSAGHYGQPFADYHVNIDADGTLYSEAQSFTEVLAHTWHQNSGSIGISILACAGATPDDLGSEPPTEPQLEAMAQVVAVVCRELVVPVDADHVRTHAEQANLDGYGPATTWERWDLWFLHNGDAPGSGGDMLRGKAGFYRDGELSSFHCQKRRGAVGVHSGRRAGFLPSCGK